MALKIGLKLILQKFRELLSAFVEVIGEKVVRWVYLPHIMKRVNVKNFDKLS